MLEQHAAVLLNGGGLVDANRRASVAVVVGRARAPGADGVAANRCAAGADSAVVVVVAGANVGGETDESCRRAV